MSVDHLYFGWYADEDGYLWVRHDCVDGVDEWHPPDPPWRLTDDAITPSFDCEKCGRHSILTTADRVEAPKAIVVTEVDRLKAAILDIDAHAAPFGTDDDGFVTGGYLVSVGSIHRALGVVGHSAPRCRLCSANSRLCAIEAMHVEASQLLLREYLEALADRLGVPIEADYGPKANGVLFDDLITVIAASPAPHTGFPPARTAPAPPATRTTT